MIYGDFCVLSDSERDKVLANIHRALRLGGYFVFDISTPRRHDRLRGKSSWSVVGHGGFWKPGPHLILFQTFDYPKQNTLLEQYIVIDESSQVSEYRIWTHTYMPETIAPVVNAQGFAIIGFYADLTGTLYQPESEWLGLITRKR
jgi:hypothetical protein